MIAVIDEIKYIQKKMLLVPHIKVYIFFKLPHIKICTLNMIAVNDEIKYI